MINVKTDNGTKDEGASKAKVYCYKFRFSEWENSKCEAV